MILVVVALLVRALVPTGYMLAPAEAGLPRIVPCAGVVLAAPKASHHHHHARGGEEAPADRACPFAAASIPALPSPPPVLAPPAIAPVPIALAALAVRPPPFQAAALRPPATGPPFTL